jgi:hypothetical protein
MPFTGLARLHKPQCDHIRYGEIFDGWPHEGAVDARASPALKS